MNTKLLVKLVLGVCSTLILTSTIYAADSIEGYWKSIDDRTGEPLSIIEFKKKIDGTYSGTIIHRYPNVSGVILTNCVKCAAPNTNKPIEGMEIVSGVTKDPKDPNKYNNATLLEVLSGRTYQGKGEVTNNGRLLRVRAFKGVSLFGRSSVWVRTAAPKNIESKIP
ncbi:DUF2147 domain-containing protein [bacterium SPL81]|nr:DUF2147 domain-containing protein [Acinetobacter baumannii]